MAKVEIKITNLEELEASLREAIKLAKELDEKLKKINSFQLDVKTGIRGTGGN